MGSGKPASGEDALIARYFRPLATDPGAFGLSDDAAALKPSGDDIVVTTDAIVEGVHFLPDDPPDTVARKALRVNLSDLAAKGATPAGFVLTLALRKPDDAWLKPFAAALGEDAAQFGCPLFGGDTVSTPGPLMVSITAFGRVPPGRMVHRSGAKAGERVMRGLPAQKPVESACGTQNALAVQSLHAVCRIELTGLVVRLELDKVVPAGMVTVERHRTADNLHCSVCLAHVPKEKRHPRGRVGIAAVQR